MKHQRIIRLTDVVLALVVAGIVAVVVWLLVTSSSDDDPAPGVPKASPTSVQTPPPITQQDLSERFGKAVPTIDRFVEIYFYRDSSSSRRKLAQHLSDPKSPLVTDSFLQTYLPSFSTESDEWVRENKGVITAKAYIAPTDIGIAIQHMTLTVEVTLRGEANSTQLPPYTTTRVIDLTWLDGRWLVDQIR